MNVFDFLAYGFLATLINFDRKKVVWGKKLMTQVTGKIKTFNTEREHK
jgi:hypothetical protein